MMPAALQFEGVTHFLRFALPLISGIARSIRRLAYCQPADLQLADDELVDPATAQMSDPIASRPMRPP
jgi:hypothetical protein